MLTLYSLAWYAVSASIEDRTVKVNVAVKA